MRSVRRGFLKYYVLKILNNSIETGYGLRKRIKEETGFWEPSEGSIYPLLDSLNDEGLIECIDESNGKKWTITGSGKDMLNKAKEAKDEMFESMIKSIQVFSELFEEEEVNRFAQEMANWRDLSPKNSELKASFLKLHRLIYELPQVKKEKRNEVTGILQRAIDDIEKETGDSENGGHT